MEKIPVEISARHLHLTKEDLEILFGKNYALENIKELSQPGMFAANEIVEIQNLEDKNKKIKKVRIVGPVRDYTQLEVSFSDSRYLGIVPPIRTSGNVENTPGFKIIGPKGEIEKKEGIIAARRHIHMNEEDAKNYEVENGQVVKVKVGKKGERSLIFDDVKIRVSDSYSLACHIDTDEGNAAGLTSCNYGELVK